MKYPQHSQTPGAEAGLVARLGSGGGSSSVPGALCRSRQDARGGVLADLDDASIRARLLVS